MDAALLKALRIQGALYCLIALGVTLFSPALGRVGDTTQLILMAVLVILLGVPHGSLDTLLAYQRYPLNTLRGWLLFGLAYFTPAALVVVLWALAPGAFLVGFLLISLVHFSGDPEAGTPVWSRLVYGGAILVLPSLLHGAEVHRLFSWLAGSAAADIVTPWLQRISLPWLLVGLLAVRHSWKRNRLTAIEILATLALATSTRPLLAFSVFFSGMHSARHILRMVRHFGRTNPQLLVLACTAPTLLFVLLLGFASLFLKDLPWEARTVRLIFVALAAVTVPHMGFVEPLRMRGWKSQNEVEGRANKP